MPPKKGKKEIIVPEFLNTNPSGKLVWIEQHDKDGEPKEYLRGTVKDLDLEKKSCNIIYDNAGKGPNPVPADQLLQRNPDPSILEDLCDINPLNNAEILLNLERKYNNNDIFCNCGPTLICINPEKGDGLKNNTEEFHDECVEWAKTDGMDKEPEPHIFVLAAKVYKQIFKTRCKQAVCISGESGAGKTFNTKRVMGFLTDICQDPNDSNGIKIEDRVLATNPILEAFGNANTVKNDDSSRFGKYFEMIVDMDSKYIKGAEIKNYLLEKSRINFQAKEERNYHVFYSFTQYCSDADRKKFLINNNGDKCKIDDFYYCSLSGRTTNPRINDEQAYKDIEESLPKFGFSEEDRDQVWKMVSVTLNTGNIKIDAANFVEGVTPCDIERNENFNNVIE